MGNTCGPQRWVQWQSAQRQSLLQSTNAELQGVKIFDGFTEKTERLMYEVLDRHVGKRTQAILPNGVVESEGRLQKGKAIIGFAHPQRLSMEHATDHLASNSPFVFTCGNLDEAAVVRVWPKNVHGESFKAAFKIVPVSEANLTEKQSLAVADFKQMLTRLLDESVPEHSIFLCQQKARPNNNLVFVGAVDDLVAYANSDGNFVKRYFGLRSITRRSIIARMGLWGTKEFKFSDGSEQYALYMRSTRSTARWPWGEYIQDHACIQPLGEFCDEKELGERVR